MIKPQPQLSIIIPIYNAEPFLYRLLTSITNQDTKIVYEIILVDDGSTDNSYEIIKTFFHNNNIYYHRQDNAGPGVARNSGLALAKGEFILFADADDYFSPHLINSSFFSIQNTDFDFVSFGSSFVDLNGIIFSSISKSIPQLSDVKILKNYLNGKLIKTVVWNKIYRKDFLRINNIIFTQHYGNEDLLFTFKVCLYSTKISIIPDILYFHTLDNINSFTNNILKVHFSTTLGILSDELNLLKITNKSHSLIDFQIYAIKVVFHLFYNKAYNISSFSLYMDFINLISPDNHIFGKKTFIKLFPHPSIFLRLFLCMNPAILWASVRVLKFFLLFK